MTKISEIEECLKELLEKGDVPSRVTNRLLLAAIIQTREQLEARMEALEFKINDNPSLIMMFKRRPILFLRYFFLIVFIIALLVTAAIARDDIISFIISIIGAL